VRHTPQTPYSTSGYLSLPPELKKKKKPWKAKHLTVCTQLNTRQRSGWWRFQTLSLKQG